MCYVVPIQECVSRHVNVLCGPIKVCVSRHVNVLCGPNSGLRVGDAGELAMAV